MRSIVRLASLVVIGSSLVAAAGCSPAADKEIAESEADVSLVSIDDIAAQLGLTVHAAAWNEKNRGGCYDRFSADPTKQLAFRRYENGAVYWRKVGSGTQSLRCIDITTPQNEKLSFDGMVLEVVFQLGLRAPQYFDHAMGGAGGLVFAGETIGGKVVGKGDIAFHDPDHTCDLVTFDGSNRDEGVALDDSAEYRGIAAGQDAMARCARDTHAANPQQRDEICQPRAMKACHDAVAALVTAARTNPTAVWNSLTAPTTSFGTFQYASVERSPEAGGPLTLSGPLATLAYVYRTRLGKATYAEGAAGTMGLNFEHGYILNNPMSGRYEVHLANANGGTDFPLECQAKFAGDESNQGVANGPIVCFKPTAKLCGPALGRCGASEHCALEVATSCQARCVGPAGEEYPGTQACKMSCESATSMLRQGKCVLGNGI